MKHRHRLYLFIFAFTLGAMLAASLGACSTVAGMGRDIESLADATRAAMAKE